MRICTDARNVCQYQDGHCTFPYSLFITVLPHYKTWIPLSITCFTHMCNSTKSSFRIINLCYHKKTRWYWWEHNTNCSCWSYKYCFPKFFMLVILFPSPSIFLLILFWIFDDKYIFVTCVCFLFYGKDLIKSVLSTILGSLLTSSCVNHNLQHSNTQIHNITVTYKFTA